MSRKMSSTANTLRRKLKKLVSRFTKKSARLRKRIQSVFHRVPKKQTRRSFPGLALWQRYGWFISRVAVIAFFVGLNISLGKAFVAQNQVGIPIPIATLLLQYGIIPGKEITVEQLTNPYKKEIFLEASDIIASINEVRAENDLPELEANDKLATAAARMLDEIATYEYDLDAEGEVTPLVDILDDSGYQYAWVHNNALVGPLSPAAAITAWLSDDDQAKALLTPEFTDIGLAVQVVDTKFMGKAGVIVQLLAQPKQVVPASSTMMLSSGQMADIHQGQPSKLVEFSDDALLEALNAYRATHGVHPLKLNYDLCTYAEKRANDLIANGGLDNHAGFIADFDAEEPPIGIAAYGGGSFGENLASQYCVNGTTGETIFAEHPTQLIEWCFDSSQKGHREAQLSKEYQDVCVRHGNNMYVVIFGHH